VIAAALKRTEPFFLVCVENGQADKAITSSRSAVGLAQHLLGVLLGVRVLARVRPERVLLTDSADPDQPFRSIAITDSGRSRS
jgi:TetR/AcrR family transcriptional repressor of nem operon